MKKAGSIFKLSLCAGVLLCSLNAVAEWKMASPIPIPSKDDVSGSVQILGMTMDAT